MKIIIIGKNGNLGSSLIKYLSKEHHIVSLGRTEMDLYKKEVIKGKKYGARDFPIVIGGKNE